MLIDQVRVWVDTGRIKPMHLLGGTYGDRIAMVAAEKVLPLPIGNLVTAERFIYDVFCAGHDKGLLMDSREVGERYGSCSMASRKKLIASGVIDEIVVTPKNRIYFAKPKQTQTKQE